jgi:hypothetical protein
MTTARDLIKDALRKIHVLGKGQSLDDDEADDALRLLNSMLAMWSVQGDLVFTSSKETFSLTGAGTYTIGSGLDFSTVAPLYITSAYVTTGSTDYDLHRIDDTEYSAISQKTIASSIPEYYYYDGNPTARIYLYPVDSGATSITINSVKPLTSFATLDTVYDMPAEYEIAIVYNLAVLIAPEYEKEPAFIVSRTANRSLEGIRAQNNRNNKRLASLGGIPTRGQTEGNIYEGYE